MKSVLVLLFLFLSLSVHAQQSEAEGLRELELGFADIKKKDPVRALVHFNRALRLAKKGSELELKAMYQIAVYYNYIEDAEKPAVIRTTLRGLNQLKKTHRTDSLAADFYFRAGLAYQWDYQPDSALHIFNEARKMYEVLYGKKSMQVSDCYHCMGDVYCQSFYDYSKAEPLYEKALAIREKKESTVLNSYLIFKLYSELALVNRSQHEPDKALLYGLRFIAYADTIPYPVYKERSYTVTAEIYRDLNRFAEAKKLYKEAIALNLKSLEGEKNILASHYLGLAETLEREGEVSESVTYYLKAIHLFNSEKGPKAIKHIYCYERLGQLYLKIDQLNEAAIVLRNGLGLLGEYKLIKSGQASSLHKSLATYFERVGLPDSALAHYQYALMASTKNFNSLLYKDNPTVSSVELKDYCYEVLLAKASLLNNLSAKTKKKSYSENALLTLMLAEELLTLSRADLDRDDSKWNFFDSNYGVYEQLIAALYEMQGTIPTDSLYRTVLKYMEKSKSKMLVEALNQANFSDPSLVNDSLINILNIHKRNLHYLQDQQKKISQALPGKGNSESLQNSILETDRNIQLTEAEINRRYPSYLKIKYNDHLPRLSQLTTYVKDKEACMLEYFWGTRKLYALGINGNETIFKCLGSTDSLAKTIIPLREFFKESKYSYEVNTVSDFNRQSYFLYQTLVSPFKALIKGSEKIIIVPDGLIGQVPFEVFTTSLLTQDINFRNLEYLIKSYIVSYSFSSSYLLSQKTNKISSPKLLAFAFTGNSDLRSGESFSNANDQIAGSAQELESLNEKFPDGQFLYGEDVTESKFKIAAPDFDIIHLAVHGRGNTDLNYSASLFFRDKNTGEDGELHWYELFGMRLKARLAVISSCESGIGRTYRGEGMLSMASAFAYAGCPNIVMGLWKVDDRTSSELMNFFYEDLLKHNPVDQSLAFSKRQYLENADELSAHPRLWASLVAYGNQGVIGKNELLTYATVFVLISIVIIIGVVIKKRRLHV